MTVYSCVITYLASKKTNNSSEPTGQKVRDIILVNKINLTRQQ